MEIEIRSLIEPQKFEELMHYFVTNGKLIYVKSQETYYFDCTQDIRIQKSDNEAKIWYKDGEMHEEAREEIEVHFDKSDFSKMLTIFERIGLRTDVKWFRIRHKFSWKDTLVFMDYTLGYGHIIELEKQGEEKDKEALLKELKRYFTELGVEQTPKEIMDNKYKHYLENWEELTKK